MPRADVIVVGAGPAGIAAAVSAAGRGMSVLLVDEAPAPGGQIWRGGGDTRAAREWLRRLRESGARFSGGTTIVDVAGPLAFAAERNGARLTLRAEHAVILATGARELFLPFPGWTLPGVVGVGGAQALVKRGWHVGGRRVVIAGSGPLLLAVAAALVAAGADVAAVVEQAPSRAVRRFARSLWRTPGRALAGARYRWLTRGARYLTGTWVVRAEGEDQVRRVQLAGEHDGAIECDVLCTGYGLVPSTELATLMGCVSTQRGVTVDDLQRTSVAGVLCAGETVAVGGVDAAIVQGRIAGLAAAGDEARARSLARVRARHAAFAGRLRVAFALRHEVNRLADAGTVVCRCEDVPYGRLDEYESLREARLHARVGMGACQGRVCGAALRHLRGWPDTAPRPPLVTASISTLTHATEPDDIHAEE